MIFLENLYSYDTKNIKLLKSQLWVVTVVLKATLLKFINNIIQLNNIRLSNALVILMGEDNERY